MAEETIEVSAKLFNEVIAGANKMLDELEFSKEQSKESLMASTPVLEDCHTRLVDAGFIEPTELDEDVEVDESEESVSEFEGTAKIIVADEEQDDE